MRGEVTPVDERTGQPLLIAPRGTVSRLFRVTRVVDGRVTVVADKNHVHHPEHHPLLQDEDGQAVQASRVQQMLRPDHTRYHWHWGGPPLPNTHDARLITIVLNAARCIPQQAIHLDRRRPYVGNLNDRQMNRLRGSGEVYVDKPGKIQAYAQRQVLAREFNQRPGLRDEFLRMDPYRFTGMYEHLDFAYLGSLIVLPSIRAATSPVAPFYEEAYDQGRLAPDAPPTAHEFFYQYLGGSSVYTLRPLLLGVRNQLLAEAGEIPMPHAA